MTSLTCRGGERWCPPWGRSGRSAQESPPCGSQSGMGPWGSLGSLLPPFRVLPPMYPNSFSLHILLGSLPHVPLGSLPEWPQPHQLLVAQAISDWDPLFKFPQHPAPAHRHDRGWDHLGFSPLLAATTTMGRPTAPYVLLCSRDRSAPLRSGVHILMLPGPVMHIQTSSKFLKR